jgi:hypothetical protein
MLSLVFYATLLLLPTCAAEPEYRPTETLMFRDSTDDNTDFVADLELDIPSRYRVTDTTTRYTVHRAQVGTGIPGVELQLKLEYLRAPTNLACAPWTTQTKLVHEGSLLELLVCEGQRHAAFTLTHRVRIPTPQSTTVVECQISMGQSAVSFVADVRNTVLFDVLEQEAERTCRSLRLRQWIVADHDSRHQTITRWEPDGTSKTAVFTFSGELVE